MGTIEVSHYHMKRGENVSDLYWEDELGFPIEVKIERGGMVSLSLALKDTNIEGIVKKAE